MALTKNTTQIKITIDGRTFGYAITSSEVNLWVKAEKLINEEINNFRKNHKKSQDVNEQDYRVDSIVVILIKAYMDLLRKGGESDETLYALNEMNSQLSSYIEKN